MLVGTLLKKRVFWGVLFLLFVTQFFGLELLNTKVYEFILALACFYMMFLSLKTSSRSSFTGKLLILFFAFFFLSSVYSSFARQQSVFHSVYVGSRLYLGIFSFFLWSKKNFSVNETLAILHYYSLFFCVCYIFQWIVYPFVVFHGATDQINISGGVFRLRMAGSIGAYYLFFEGVKTIQNGKVKKGVAWTVLAALPIIIMGFRSLTILTLLCGGLLLFQLFKVNSSKSWLVSFFILLFAMAFFQVPIVQQKMNEMQERQDSDQTFSNTDYIRYLEYQYYTNRVFVYPGDRYFGGGLPVDGAYAYLVNSSQERGLYWIDLGLVGLAMIIGPITVLLLIIVVLHCAWRCRDRGLLHLRYTLLAVFGGSVITSMEIYRFGNLSVIGVMLYLAYEYERMNNYKEPLLLQGEK